MSDTEGSHTGCGYTITYGCFEDDCYRFELVQSNSIPDLQNLHVRCECGSQMLWEFVQERTCPLPTLVAWRDPTSEDDTIYHLPHFNPVWPRLLGAGLEGDIVNQQAFEALSRSVEQGANLLERMVEQVANLPELTYGQVPNSAQPIREGCGMNPAMGQYGNQSTTSEFQEENCMEEDIDILTTPDSMPALVDSSSDEQAQEENGAFFPEDESGTEDECDDNGRPLSTFMNIATD